MFRGKYKKRLGSGVPNTYGPKDTVLFQGNLYEAKQSTSFSPVEKPDYWEYKGVSEIYISDNPPFDPQIGQVWSTSGKFYTYFYDGNNYAWVEL